MGNNCACLLIRTASSKITNEIAKMLGKPKSLGVFGAPILRFFLCKKSDNVYKSEILSQYRLKLELYLCRTYMTHLPKGGIILQNRDP